MLGRGKSDEQKRREQMQEQAAVKDSVGTNNLEAGLVQQRQKEQENTRNQLLDTNQVKKELKKALLGKQPVQVPLEFIECKNCESRFRQKLEECKECESTEFVRKQSETKKQIQWIQTSEKQLVSKKGFDMIWSEVQGSVNENLTGSYLPAPVIDNVVYSTCGTLIKQIYGNYWKYGIDNADDAAQVIDIIRKNVLATANKARGGRALKSQEKTVIEKISHAISGSEDDDEDGVKGLF